MKTSKSLEYLRENATKFNIPNEYYEYEITEMMEAYLADSLLTCEVIIAPDELDGFAFEMDITSCCKIGPITSENYCSKCGAKIKRT